MSEKPVPESPSPSPSAADVLNDPFNIRVGFIGRCSVGKSTMINAIIGHKVCDVKAAKSTATINYFPLIVDPSKPTTSYCEELTQTNKRIREQQRQAMTATGAENSSKIGQEGKCYPAHISKEVIPIASNFQLVLIDTPGFDEQVSVGGTSMEKLIEAKWKHFDLVCVVVEKCQVLNPSIDLGKLMALLKRMRREHPEIPFLILLNKIDDLDDEDAMELKTIMEDLIFKEFYPSDATVTPKDVLLNALDCVNEGFSWRSDPNQIYLPLLAPMSAKTAYIFGSASKWAPASFESKETLVQAAADLRSENKELFDELGRAESGYHFKKLSIKEQNERIGECLPNCFERTQEANFDMFQKLLTYFVGGHERQAEICKRHLQLLTAQLDSSNGDIATLLRPIYKAQAILGADVPLTHSLQKAFWDKWNEKKEVSIDKFVGMEHDLSKLHSLASQLTGYFDFIFSECKNETWANDQLRETMSKLREIVSLQLEAIIKNAKSCYTGCLHNWSRFNLEDYNNIFTSINTASARTNGLFADCFGNHFSQIRKLRYYEDKHRERQTKRGHPPLEAKFVCMDHPVSHPSNWGHLGYLFCQYKKRMTQLEYDDDTDIQVAPFQQTQPTTSTTTITTTIATGSSTPSRSQRRNTGIDASSPMRPSPPRCGTNAETPITVADGDNDFSQNSGRGIDA